jgi:hypothetical protein
MLTSSLRHASEKRSVSTEAKKRELPDAIAPAEFGDLRLVYSNLRRRHTTVLRVTRLAPLGPAATV